MCAPIAVTCSEFRNTILNGSIKITFLIKILTSVKSKKKAHTQSRNVSFSKANKKAVIVFMGVN